MNKGLAHIPTRVSMNPFRRIRMGVRGRPPCKGLAQRAASKERQEGPVTSSCHNYRPEAKMAQARGNEVEILPRPRRDGRCRRAAVCLGVAGQGARVFRRLIRRDEILRNEKGRPLGRPP